MASVVVPARRVARWMENFETRHGSTALTVASGKLSGAAEDGSTFTAHLPFDQAYDGPADAQSLALAALAPSDWGILLVRKGGFAIVRMQGETQGESKVGRRHVQGRTKAGGQSQQRFARRRDNQSRQAMEAAAGHADRILDGVPLLVVGGDHAAVEATLAETRLTASLVGPFLTVPDPRRAELDQAVRDAQSLTFHVVNA